MRELLQNKFPFQNITVRKAACPRSAKTVLAEGKDSPCRRQGLLSQNSWLYSRINHSFSKLKLFPSAIENMKKKKNNNKLEKENRNLIIIRWG
jgi:hypothetical protein